MYVEELFEGSSLDKRLFLVNIPESQIYNLEQMMVMLCHEIGHFVGGQIRERSIRKKRLIKALARMIAQKKEEQKKVQDVFNVSKADTIESAMLQIEKVIEEYRNLIQQKMSQIIKDKKNCVEMQ